MNDDQRRSLYRHEEKIPFLGQTPRHHRQRMLMKGKALRLLFNPYDDNDVMGSNEYPEPVITPDASGHCLGTFRQSR